LPDLPLAAAGTGWSAGAVVSVLAENGKVVVITSLVKARQGKDKDEGGGKDVDAYGG
jgi:hypothetical protein